MGPYTVITDTENGYVAIYRNGQEILYWDRLEWEEDPDLLFAIVNAVVMATTDQECMDAKLRNMKKL